MHGVRLLLAAGLCVALLPGVRSGCAVGPPPRSGRLTREQEKRLGEVDVALWKAADASEMGRATRLAEEVESLRRAWQGPTHWQTTDARYRVESWARLARLSPASQKGAGRAMQRAGAGLQLVRRRRLADAERE